MGGLTAGATVAMAGAAQAATTYTVGTTDDTSAAADCGADNTDCSLRQAITLANGDTAFDSIEFHTGLTGTVLLGSSLPTITAPLDIDGPGADAITISGDDAYRIFDINQTTNGAGTTIGLLTLAHGSAPEAINLFPGGAGGAIRNANASLTVSHSILTGNTAGSFGGAIISGASAPSTGQFAYLYLSDSTVSGNSVDADGFAGGGVYLNYGGAAIDNITVSGNYAPHAGGGIAFFEMHSHVGISSSTIAGNTAGGTSTTSGGGGGLFSSRNDHGIALMNSTVAGNSAARGGGILSEGFTNGGGTELPWTITNTIIATNNAATDPDLGIDPGNGTASFDTSFDLIKSPGAAPITETVAGSNVIGVDPKLGPLAENGALNGTQTMAPECESPAIDKGNSPFFLTADQRGFTRPVDLGDYPNSTAVDADGSDIGAVELETTPLTTCTPPPPPGGVTPAGPTGQRASALKRCKKKKSAQARKKCKKKAKRLPV